MLRKHKIVSASGIIILSLAILNIIIIRAGFANNENWYWALAASVPLLVLAIFNILENIHASKFFRRTDAQTTKSFEEIYFDKIKQLKNVQNLQSQLN